MGGRQQPHGARRGSAAETRPATPLADPEERPATPADETPPTPCAEEWRSLCQDFGVREGAPAGEFLNLVPYVPPPPPRLGRRAPPRRMVPEATPSPETALAKLRCSGDSTEGATAALPLTEHCHRDVRLQALQKLPQIAQAHRDTGDISGAAIEAALARIKDADVQTRSAALAALAELPLAGGQAVVVAHAVAASLRDWHRPTRLVAVRTLRRFGGDAEAAAVAVEALVSALGDSQREVRQAVAGALRHLATKGERRTIESVARWLDTTRTELHDVVAEVLQVVAARTDAVLIGALACRLASPTERVRTGASHALQLAVDLADAAAAEAVAEQLAHEDPDVQHAAAALLLQCCGPAAIEPTRQCLLHPSEPVRVQALRVLVGVGQGNHDAIAVVGESLQDAGAVVRAFASASLRGLLRADDAEGWHLAQSWAEEAMAHDDESVQEAGAIALNGLSSHPMASSGSAASSLGRVSRCSSAGRGSPVPPDESRPASPKRRPRLESGCAETCEEARPSSRGVRHARSSPSGWSTMSPMYTTLSRASPVPPGDADDTPRTSRPTSSLSRRRLRFLTRGLTEEPEPSPAEKVAAALVRVASGDADILLAAVAELSKLLSEFEDQAADAAAACLEALEARVHGDAAWQVRAAAIAEVARAAQRQPSARGPLLRRLVLDCCGDSAWQVRQRLAVGAGDFAASLPSSREDAGRVADLFPALAMLAGDWQAEVATSAVRAAGACASALGGGGLHAGCLHVAATALEHRCEEVRIAAFDLISRVGSAEDDEASDEVIADEAIVIAAATAEAAAGRLEHHEDSVRAAGATALAKLNTPSAVRAAASRLQRGAANMRIAALDALAGLARSRQQDVAEAAVVSGVAALADVDASVRGAALERFRALQPQQRRPALGAITACLGSHEGAVRLAAVAALAEVAVAEDAEIFLPLADRLADDYPGVRQVAAEMLARLAPDGPPDAVETVAAVLEQPEADARASAHDVLVKVATAYADAGAGVAHAAATRLEHRDGVVRGAAVQLLAAVAPCARMDVAVELSARFVHEDPGVREAALQAAGELARAIGRGVGEIISVMEAHTHSPLAHEREAAVVALGHLVVGRPSPELSRIERCLADTDGQVKAAAVAALASILPKQDAAVTNHIARPLQWAGGAERSSRLKLLMLIAKRGQVAVQVAVVSCLEDPDADVRREALETLAEVRPPPPGDGAALEVVAAATARMECLDRQIRQAAVAALRIVAGRGDRGALAEIAARLRHATWCVRFAAADALLYFVPLALLDSVAALRHLAESGPDEVLWASSVSAISGLLAPSSAGTLPAVSSGGAVQSCGAQDVRLRRRRASFL